MLEFVEYGNSKIAFKIKRSDRKTLGISVLPCGSIEVTAPQDAQLDRIKSLVLKRGAWLLEQMRIVEYNPIPQPTKQFQSGESYYFLGRHYRLKVFESSYDSVDILDDRIVLNCTDPGNSELKRASMLDWYMRKAIEVLTQRFNFLSAKFEQTNIDLNVKKLAKRWGEFHPNKNLVVLNSELVVAPVECIDYVVTHELTHAIVLDHSSEFYSLLTHRSPNWKALKLELERHSVGFGPLELG